MGCGLISQRGPSVEVHHPIALDPSGRAAGARVVEHGGGEGAVAAASSSSSGPGPRQGANESRGAAALAAVGGRGSGGNGVSGGTDAPAHSHLGGSSGPSGVAGEGQQLRGQFPGRGLSGRRFMMGERVVLASRLPAYAQDHAFCFECGSFFQLGSPRTPACSRCGGDFVQFLRQPGFENWIAADSTTGVSFSFDDQLQNSISASMEETPIKRTPTQGAFLRCLPTAELVEADVQAREKLDPRDPRRGCAICREGFVVGAQVKRLPCGHEFHGDCIVSWLQGSNTCPICRARLPEAREDEQDEEKDEVLRLKLRSGGPGAVPSERAPGDATSAHPRVVGSSGGPAALDGAATATVRRAVDAAGGSSGGGTPL